MVADDGTQMTLHPSVLGLSLPFAPSPPMKVFNFWQNFWTKPSTISPSHAINKFWGRNPPSIGKLLTPIGPS